MEWKPLHTAVMGCLLAHHNRHTGHCWPERRLLAAHCNVSERTIDRALAQLTAWGAIERQQPKGVSSQQYRPTQYVFLFTLPQFVNSLVDSAVNPGVTGDEPCDKFAGAVRQNGQEPCDKIEGPIRKEGKVLNQEKVHKGKSITPDGALMSQWLQIKNELRQQIGEEAYALWVRPMYLLKELSGGTLLLALPPASKIVDAARENRDVLLQAILRHGFKGIGFTRYPGDEEICALAGRSDEWGEAARRIARKRSERWVRNALARKESA